MPNFNGYAFAEKIDAIIEAEAGASPISAANAREWMSAIRTIETTLTLLKAVALELAYKKCERCGGEGIRIDRPINPPTRIRFPNTPCPDCKGIGYVEKEGVSDDP